MSQSQNDVSITIPAKDLPKTKQKKKYDLTDDLIEMCYIDAKDSVNNWCMAQIIERCDDDNTIKVNFDGWSHRWDEWFKFTSSKISPFRKYSTGYSGQTKVAIRDWKYKEDDLKARIENLDRIIESNFAVPETPFEITQTFRGSEYVYLDSLLQHTFDNPREDLPLVFEYITRILKLYVKYLNLLPELLPEHIEGTINLDAFLTNERVALSQCLYELSDSVNKIFGANERIWKHFKANDKSEYEIKLTDSEKYAGEDMELYWTEDEEDPDNQKRENSFLVCQLVNLFGELGGFEAWTKAFTYYIDDKDPNNWVLPPFRYMRILITNILTIYPFLNESVYKDLLPQAREAIVRRLNHIGDKEIKDLDKDMVSSFISKAEQFLKKFYRKEDVYALTESCELDLALKFLKCPYFEKRLKGITEIKELSEKIDANEYMSKNHSAVSSQNSKKTMSPRKFIKWIFKNQIFELILGDSMHNEIIKRTNDVLKFIAKYETFPKSLIDLLWKACEGKHEAILIALYDVIIQIADHLDDEAIERLKEKIESIPEEEINEITLNLIKGFASNTLPRFSDLDSSKVDESQYHCLSTLWRLALDDSKVSPQLSESALYAFLSVIKEKSCQPMKKIYLKRCLDNIKKGYSVAQSYHVVHHLLVNTYYYRNPNSQSENSLQKILIELDNEYDLVELSIQEFFQFHEKMQRIIAKLPNTPTEAEKEKIYFGKYSYQVNFNNRLIFLEYILTNPTYELTLSLKQIETIWDCLALDPIWESDKDYMFKWISRQNDPQRSSEATPLIPDNLLPEFFEKIICNHKKLDFFSLSPEGFECFSAFFRLINDKAGKIKIVRAKRFKVQNLEYEGKSTLWAIFLNCKNEETIELIVKLLVECNLKLGPSLESKKKEVWEGFVIKCINLLKEGSQKQNERLISKAVMVLMNFFDRYEGKVRESKHTKDEVRGYNMMLTLVLKPDNINKNIIINSSRPVKLLRKKISEEFQIPIDEFKIIIKGSVVEPEDDDCLITHISYGGPINVQKIDKATEVKNEYHPKRILAENSEYVDLLFKLLSEDYQAVNDIWDLLMRLPVNEKIKKSIYEISGKWETLLDIQSLHVHRLLYCLQIIENFVLDTERERSDPINVVDSNAVPYFKDKDWVKKFLQSNGVQVLIELLLVKELHEIKSLISIKCISIILKIVCYFFTSLNYKSLFGDKTAEYELKVNKRLIEIIHFVSEYSIQREAREADQDKSNVPVIVIPPNYNQDKKIINENDYFESECIHYAQYLYIKATQSKTELLKIIYEYPSLEKLLSVGLIEVENIHLKGKLAHGILTLLAYLQMEDINPRPHQFFVPILLQKTLEVALKNQDRSDTFFNLLSNIMNNVDISQCNMDVDAIINKLVEFIKNRKPVEITQKDHDIVLNGILLLLIRMFNRFPDKSERYGQENGLIKELLEKCLFEIPRRPDRKKVPGPKCKNINTRTSALRLVGELSKSSYKNLQSVTAYLLPIHKNGKWRTKRAVDWYITPKENEKSSTGYVGLKNLGCICYMNSTIQQLYMIPTFRRAILAVEDQSYTPATKDDNVLYQLKCIFLALNESEKQYFNPKGFCQSFKDWDGNPTNVYEQMDADEFFNIFMDRLENLIKGTVQENVIKQHFGGVLSTELICKGCPHYSEREEPFMALSLQVKNKKSLLQSLSSFVEGEMLEGDNAYFCEECKKKVNTLRRVCVKKLPNHLICVMKRFEFDYDTMQKVKINDYCEFPMKLNIEPYTQQGLRKAERSKKNENGQNSEEPPITDEYPADYFEYKLTGVVIHLGSADSGHYYSLIQDQELPDIPEDKRWYEFNDTFVTRFDPKDIPSEAYGGEEKWKYYSGVDFGNLREKIKNAYLLFYERIVHHDESEFSKNKAQETKKKEEEAKEDKPDEISTEKVSPSKMKNMKEGELDPVPLKKEISEIKECNVPKEVYESIIEKNQIFHIRKHIFSREYFDFISDLLDTWHFEPNLEYTETHVIDPQAHPKQYYDTEIIKIGITFFLTATIRERNRNGIIKFLPLLKKLLTSNLPASLWLLRLFTSSKVVGEFILDCPVNDMRRFVVGLLVHAARVVFDFEGKGSNNNLFSVDEQFYPTTYLANFLNCFICHIIEAKRNSRDYTEFFRLFSEITGFGREIANYFISKKLIGRFMDFFFDNLSPSNEYFRNYDDVKYKEPEEIDIGPPQIEKVKVRTAWEELLKKRERQIESHMARRSYLWKTVSQLIVYCRFKTDVERCSWQVGEDDEILDDHENVLLTPEAKFIEKVIADATDKVGMRSVAKIYSYLCYEDLVFTKTFLKAIYNGLSNLEVTAIKPFLKCFSTLMTLQDVYTEHRVKELCESLMTVLKECENYYCEIETFTSFILKLVGRQEAAKSWFLANKERWSWLVDWLESNPTPPNMLSSGTLKFQRKRGVIGLGGSLKYDMVEYKVRSGIKVRKFKELLEGDTEDVQHQWDSDEDLADHKFELNEQFDFDPRRTGKYQEAHIGNILEEMIQLVYKGDEGEESHSWVPKDSEEIAPFRSKLQFQEEIDAEIAKEVELKSPEDAEHQNSDNDTEPDVDSMYKDYMKVDDGFIDDDPIL